MYQCNTDEQYQKYEEDCWQRGIELEEKRRRKDQEHDDADIR